MGGLIGWKEQNNNKRLEAIQMKFNASSFLNQRTKENKKCNKVPDQKQKETRLVYFQISKIRLTLSKLDDWKVEEDDSLAIVPPVAFINSCNIRKYGRSL